MKIKGFSFLGVGRNNSKVAHYFLRGNQKNIDKNSLIGMMFAVPKTIRECFYFLNSNKENRMNLSLKNFFSIMALVAMTIPSTVFAQSADLEAQVKELTQKVAALESAKSAPSTGTYVMPTEGGENKGGFIHTPQDIDFGGYVAASYTEHIDQSQNYQGKVYDQNQGFNLNQADFYFKKDAPAEGGAGFKIDILAGRDNTTMQSASTGSAVVSQQGISSSRVDFNEAFIDVNTPTGVDSDILPSVVNWKVGRMVTLAGREVINPAANWNISRSVGYGYGLPFRHTGLRTNSKWFNDKVDFYAGINNGWDNDIETNSSRTVEFAVGFSPIENVKYFTTILYGSENVGTAEQPTFLWTHVLDWSVTKALSLGADIDWGRTQNAFGGTNSKNDNWMEISGYARYQINDKWAAAFRSEIFQNQGQSRAFALSTAAGPGVGGNDTIFGNTFTLEYAMYENLITRLEYRLDKANGNDGIIFGGDSSRNTLAAQMIYTI